MLGFVAIPLTVFYIVGAINAVNMFDGLDGLAAGIASFSLAGFSYLYFTRADFVDGCLALILIGSLSGFLIFNFHPARIFMGNNGSAFLGYILAVFAIQAAHGNRSVISILGSIFLVGLPVLDAGVAILRRAIAGKPIYLGDRSHIYDQLVDKGFTVRQTALFCYTLQLGFVFFGLWLFQRSR
jgi:UDP-GlcNAc:undecaprenyl-phosphate GlcNAc-1-phosphate transferase